jgi:hypothetical protein
MRALLAAVALLVGAFVLPAQARIDIHVDKSAQRMAVVENGVLRHVWRVSTARSGKVTPNGNFRPQSMRVMHRSSIYNNAPMPHSIFYSGNYAIHGTVQTSRLGSPASAGCVRLHPANARQLFAMVQRSGMGNTRIMVRSGQPPADVVAQMRNFEGEAVVAHATPDPTERHWRAQRAQPTRVATRTPAPRETVASQAAASRLVAATRAEQVPPGFGVHVTSQGDRILIPVAGGAMLIRGAAR